MSARGAKWTRRELLGASASWALALSLKPSGMASAESTAQNARPGGRGRPNIVLFVPDELRAGRFLRPVPPFRHPLARASRTPPAPPLPRGAAGVERAHAVDRCRIPQGAGGVLRAGELFRLAPRRADRSPGPDRTLARYGPDGVLGSRRLRGRLRPGREVALGPGGLPDPRAPQRPHSRWHTGTRVTGAGRALRCHADLSRSRRHEGDAYSFRAQPHATAPRLGGRSTARRLHGRRLQHLRAPGFRADHRGALRPEDTAAERAARNHHPLRLSAHPPLQVHRSPQRSERALRLRAGPEAREQSLRRQFRARGARRAREASHELVHRYHGCSAPGAGSARCPGPRPPSRAQARRAAGEPPRSLGAERFHGAGGRFARGGVAGVWWARMRILPASYSSADSTPTSLRRPCSRISSRRCSARVRRRAASASRMCAMSLARKGRSARKVPIPPVNSSTRTAPCAL